MQSHRPLRSYQRSSCTNSCAGPHLVQCIWSSDCAKKIVSLRTMARVVGLEARLPDMDGVSPRRAGAHVDFALVSENHGAPFRPMHAVSRGRQRDVIRAAGVCFSIASKVDIIQAAVVRQSVQWQATDNAERLNQSIRPPQKAGETILPYQIMFDPFKCDTSAGGGGS